MRFKSAELYAIEIPMLVEVEHALASRSVARNILLKITAEDGSVGFGESCPRHYVTGETFEQAWQTLTDELLPQLKQLQGTDVDQLMQWLSAQTLTLPRNKHAAFCAMELALLDLIGQQQQLSAGGLFATVSPNKQQYSGVIAAGQPEKAVAMAQQIKQLGVPCTKVKLHQQGDLNVAILQAVREILGPDHDLRGDANCAWQDADEAQRQLTELRPFGLNSIEQPLESDDIDGLAALTKAAITPVMVDESMCSLADAEQLIDRQACNLFNVRISKCGGLNNSYRIVKLANEHGIDCQLGAQVGETSCLSAAGLALASIAPTLRWREGCFGTLLLAHDIFEPPLMVGPRAQVAPLTGYGLGLQISTAQLSACQQQHWQLKLEE
ncbi:hypothetical protein K0504_11855 [Neiella marina]|uniref:Mandelate racemase/muconate lactonizing enzyme C-terminal domain-containing protein n=1 Tax=Neiella holothuriorum TaxID=2870530 RepID=A0ABS7EHG4_9GAMM|nr:enolase C-terminal domain-like protein [Neiella holothuriorum]MBW8191730.1 hypothetical protein [Neiella holothuriorum]